jgi:hypothetical protein
MGSCNAQTSDLVWMVDPSLGPKNQPIRSTQTVHDGVGCKMTLLDSPLEFVILIGKLRLGAFGRAFVSGFSTS